MRTCFLADLEYDGNSASLRGQKGRELRAKGGQPSFAPEAMKEYTTTRQLMERYSVPGLVLRLGVPAMVGQVFNLLYSIVDRIFVGRIPGTGE